jgi:hypothetical protein
MTIAMMSQTHGVSDIGAGRVSNYAADDRAHGTSGQQARTRAHGAIIEPLPCCGAGRRESNTGGNYCNR